MSRIILSAVLAATLATMTGAQTPVFDHPFFTIPELDGAFELPNVPAGDYVLVDWHERVGERTATVHVERGKSTAVSLSLPVEDTQ